jgi:hypothetical protein
MGFQRVLVAARGARVVALVVAVPAVVPAAVPAAVVVALVEAVPAAAVVVAPQCLSVAAVGPGHLEVAWSRLVAGDLQRRPGVRRRSRR